jgi:hypothetical protein
MRSAEIKGDIEELSGLNMKSVIVWVGVIFFLSACIRDAQKEQSISREKHLSGRYALVEQFEITEGPQTGMKGESSYIVDIRPDVTPGFFVIGNFANAYDLRAQEKKMIFVINKQKFLYYNDSVTITGGGKFNDDSLYLECVSGGPAGIITSICRGKKYD